MPMSAQELRQAILAKHLEFSQGKDLAHASLFDMRMALTLSIRDKVIEPWFRATRATYAAQSKRVYYLSMEFLIGRLLEDAVMNLGLTELANEAVAGLGFDFRSVVDDEPDAALGNGGLGRLAACFLDLMATLGLPVLAMASAMNTACSAQSVLNGRQVEEAEDWLRQQHPLGIPAPRGRLPHRVRRHRRRGWTVAVWTPEAAVIANGLRHAGLWPRHGVGQYPASVACRGAEQPLT